MNSIFVAEGPYYRKHKHEGYGTDRNLFNKVELEITSDCNLKCLNCDRSCRQAPSKECITLEEIENFVNESLTEKHLWNRIVILGGEPTLHPYLPEILNILEKYKNVYDQCEVRLYSNGFGKKVNNVLKTIPSWVRIKNSRKKDIHQDHCSYNDAPVDHGLPAKACSVPWRCGLGFTRNWYYPCGAGASIDRVFQFGIGIRKIKDLTFENLIKQFSKLCLYCGYNPLVDTHVKEEVQSKSWVKVYKKYVSKIQKDCSPKNNHS